MTGNEAARVPGPRRHVTVNRVLLLAALVAATVVYWPCLSASWFYDDWDYVVGDPRLDDLTLFLPSRWNDAPPALPGGDEELERHLPSYGKPLIGDRYLWRLSYAVERRLAGPDYSERVAHAVNLALHLLCIIVLFAALKALAGLYAEEYRWQDNRLWGLWPGLAALVFAVHPWAAEPACYITARNAGLGAVFVLAGLVCWVVLLRETSGWLARALALLGMLLCVAAAYSSKESFVAAPAAYLLVTWPILWRRVWHWSPAGASAALAGVTLLLLAVAWLGVRGSDRAGGLLAQAGGGRGWQYFFEIQNPLLLSTLADQLPCARVSLEANHPGWSSWACWAGLAANLGLLAAGLAGGWRRPLLLGLGWFYVLLLPTNSFLPRPDFLAMRNVYLPAAGCAALAAGVLLWLLARWATVGRRDAVRLNPARVACYFAVFAVVWFYWAGTARWWADGFAEPAEVWSRSARVAPDHAAVRLNLALTLWNREGRHRDGDDREIEGHLLGILAAENSATMQYHTERPKALLRMTALRLLGALRRQQGRLEEAEQFLMQSWREYPNLQTWLQWVEVCSEAGLKDRLAVVVDEGLRHWPGKWWPVVVRGIVRGSGSSADALPHDVRCDLEAAERAPDAQLADLRMLQIRVLSALATNAAPSRAEALTRRIERLGASLGLVESVRQASPGE